MDLEEEDIHGDWAPGGCFISTLHVVYGPTPSKKPTLCLVSTENSWEFYLAFAAALLPPRPTLILKFYPHPEPEPESEPEPERSAGRRREREKRREREREVVVLGGVDGEGCFSIPVFSLKFPLLPSLPPSCSFRDLL